MSWLSDATGVHISPHSTYLNRDQFGRALKVAAPLASIAIPGLGAGLGALVGGLGSAAGHGIQHGANFGSILGAGAMGAAGGAAGGQLSGGHGLAGLKARFAGGFVPGSSPETATSAFNGYAAGPSGGWNAVGAQAGKEAGGQSALSNLGSAFGHAASGAAHFAGANPQAIGMGLQGLGNISQAGAENRLRGAQADSLAAQTAATQQTTAQQQAELLAQQKRAAALAPLLQSLIGQAGQFSNQQFTPNPYAVKP